MNPIVQKGLAAAVAGSLIGWLGMRRGLLSQGGAAMAAVSIVLIWMLGGWPWGAAVFSYWLLYLVFVPFRRRAKAGFSERHLPLFREGWMPVAARMSWPIFLAMPAALSTHSTALLGALIGALATGAADLLGTEVGLLSIPRPRLLTSWRHTQPGRPGGISLLGLVASMGGAWFIGLVALIVEGILAWQAKIPIPRAVQWLPFAGMTGGTLASLVDSFLGATAQGLYYCERCDVLSESRQHHCGQHTEQVRGWAWLDNEVVDFASAVVGAAIAMTLVSWLAR